jgi:hypothetical protein
MKSLLAIPAVLLVASFAVAEVSSGPKAGDKVVDFKAFGVVGSIEGKEGSYVAERKDEPTVFVFIQQEHWTRPMARFLKVLDTDAKTANDKSAVCAVWLTEKPDMIKEYLPKAQTSLSFTNTSLGVFEGEKTGPNNWGINVDAHITVVVAHKGKVIDSVALQSVNETDVKKVVELLKKAK